jgi:hypothetical protein
VIMELDTMFITNVVLLIVAPIIAIILLVVNFIGKKKTGANLVRMCMYSAQYAPCQDLRGRIRVPSVQKIGAELRLCWVPRNFGYAL